MRNITILSNPGNEPVTVKGEAFNLECIGVGTDAAVFRYVPIPKYAFKLYADDRVEKKLKEQQVYEKLGESQYFPHYYGAGENFLVVSYEKGVTLYDCLLKGIHIPEKAIRDVEDARVYARAKGLNPRDIHLKNILLHEGRAKILDVSEYMKTGNDRRWEYLKQGYEAYYHLIDGKALPIWMLEITRKWFHLQKKSPTFDFDEFAQKLSRLFRIG